MLFYRKPLQKSLFSSKPVGGSIALDLENNEVFNKVFSLIIIIMIKLNHSSIDGVRMFEI